MANLAFGLSEQAVDDSLGRVSINIINKITFREDEK
jgi:hypothetical protein